MNISHFLTCAFLIPAGLVGISTGLHEILVAVDGLPGLVALIDDLNQRIEPWAGGLLCCIIGLIMLAAAAALAVRGLQSGP